VSGWRTPRGGAGPRGGRGGSELRADVHEPQPAGEDESTGCPDAGGRVAAPLRIRSGIAPGRETLRRTTTGSRFRSAEAPQCHGPSYSPSSCS
jgi:hypothetical protein